MSVESIARALQVQQLTPTQKLVLVGIANHDGDGGAWPSRATLARYACCSERHVKRILRELEDLGLVVTHRQQGGNTRTPEHLRPNLYSLNLAGYPQGGPNTSPGNGDTGGHPGPLPPDTHVPPGGTPMSPEPSLNHPEPSAKESTDVFTRADTESVDIEHMPVNAEGEPQHTRWRAAPTDADLADRTVPKWLAERIAKRTS